MAAKLKPRFVALVAVDVVVEFPTSSAMDEMPDIVFLVTPKSYDPAMLAVFAPTVRIEMPLGVDRTGEAISVARASRRVLRRARQG